MLREAVTIKTAIGELHGELFVGVDGLPELLVDCGCPEYYRPATFPAAWKIHWKLLQNPTMVLMHGWDTIVNLREDIQAAQREAESYSEDRDRAEQREIDNRIAMEIDERRGT